MVSWTFGAIKKAEKVTTLLFLNNSFMFSWILKGEIGQALAPDASFAALNDKEIDENLANATIKSLSITTASPSLPTTPTPTPTPTPTHTTPGPTPLPHSPLLSSPLHILVLEACTQTAVSLSSPNNVWEKRKAVFNICSERKTLIPKKEEMLKKKLNKDRSLRTTRCCNMANLVQDGFTPLHAAAHVGNLSAMNILLSFPEVLVSTRDLQGRTALHVAAEAGELEAVELLKKALSAELNDVDPSGVNAPVDLVGRTPLGWCSTSKEKKAISMRSELEKSLYSPGDNSICPITPLAGRYSSNGGFLSYGHGDLPGWRVDMEDAICAHYPIAQPDNNNNDNNNISKSSSKLNSAGLFGVFDGHSGDFVSKFVAARFRDCLVNTDEWLSGADDDDTVKAALIKGKRRLV